MDGEGETSVSKPDKPFTQDVRETNSNEDIYKAMMYSNKLGNNKFKNQLTFNKFTSAFLPGVMVTM